MQNIANDIIKYVAMILNRFLRRIRGHYKEKHLLPMKAQICAKLLRYRTHWRRCILFKTRLSFFLMGQTQLTYVSYGNTDDHTGNTSRKNVHLFLYKRQTWLTFACYLLSACTTVPYLHGDQIKLICTKAAKSNIHYVWYNLMRKMLPIFPNSDFLTACLKGASSK